MPLPTDPVPSLTVAATVLALTASCLAQCDLQPLPADPVPFLSGSVLATTHWDPDGAGPAAALLVVAGENLSAGTSGTTGLVAHDGSQWLPLVSPQASRVTSLAVHNGLLVAACTTFGTSAYQLLKTFDGLGWSTIGSLPFGEVAAMASYGGELVVGGDFAYVGFQPLSRIARWNGSVWSPLGTGVVGSVLALAAFSGSLYVGGSITSAGGVAVTNLAAWNGAGWFAVGNPDGVVRTLATRITTNIASSYLFAGGSFTSIGGTAAANFARYNTATNVWTTFGGGVGGEVCRAILPRPTGLTSTEFTVALEDAVFGHRALRWTGTAWVQHGSLLAAVPTAISYHSGQVRLGLASQDDSLIGHDGAGWTPVAGQGIAGRVQAILDFGSEVVIGGTFATISGVATHGIARGNPGNWSPLGGGVSGTVNALARAPNGDVIAGGEFAAAGGVPAGNIARWDGGAWTPLGLGTDGPVHALAFLPSGDLVAGGAFTLAGGGAASRLARWDGTAWSPIAGGVDATVRALLPLPGGDLVVGGDFALAGAVAAAHVARTDFGSWSPLGAGTNGPVHGLALDSDGRIVAGGAFTSASGTPARGVGAWNGTYWATYNGFLHAPLLFAVHAIGLLPNDEPVAGGLTGYVGFTQTNLARSRDQEWTSLHVTGVEVAAVVVRPVGEILVGGDFHAVQGQVAGNFAVLRTPCPATVVPYGSGCAGPGGIGVLTASTLPWNDLVFRSHATGMPANGVAVVVFGFSPISVPLAALLPEGLPGCDLLASLEIVAFGVPTAGAFDTEVHLAPTPSLLGVTLYHQVGAVDVNGAQVVGISTTNALALTVGSF